MNLNLPSRSAGLGGKRAATITLAVAMLQLFVNASAQTDTEPPTIAITGVTTTKLAGVNNYRFVYSIAATDNDGIAELEIHGAVAGGNFDAWRPYPYYEGFPIEILLQCTEFRFEVRAKDLAGNYSAPAGHHFVAEPEITSAGNAKGKVGKSFVYRINASTADRYACSKLPQGLKFNKKIGKISGKPRKSGQYKITLSAINAVGTKNLTLRLKIGE